MGQYNQGTHLIPHFKDDILFARMIKHILFNFQITFDNFYVLQMLSVMALSTNRAVLSLYKTMLRESQKFTDLNYRSWALRRVRDGFRANSKLAEQSSVESQIQYAKQNLIIMKRQTTVGQLFNFLTWELNWVLIYILKFEGNNNLVKEVYYKEAYLNTSSFVAMLVIEINMRRRK